MFGIGLVVIALDQYTKHLVRQYRPLHTSWNPIAWLEPIVTLTHTRNTGVAFGLFPDKGFLFIIVALVVIVAIVVYYRQLASASWVLRVAIGLQLGGATGNLIDRLARGYVTDFIDVRVWPIFNIADSSVVVGAIVLAYYALFMDRPPSSEESRADEPEPRVENA